MVLFNKTVLGKDVGVSRLVLGGVLFTKTWAPITVSTRQLAWQLNKAIAPSQPSGLPTVLSYVRYWMNSRRHLLAKSICGLDL
jgi:hypothetical protein